MCMVWLCSSSSFLFCSICFSYQCQWKCKSTSPSAISVKNWWKTMCLREIRHNKVTWKRWTNFWHVIMLDSLIVTYIQYVIKWTELQIVLNQELKCLCSKSTTVLLEWTVPKTMQVSLKLIYCIEIYVYCIHSTYKVVSKIFETDTVKIVKLTIWPIGHRHPRSSSLLHVRGLFKKYRTLIFSA